MTAPSLILFTDLDGTLLNSETYSYAAALPALNHLRSQGIPVIPVTSKTRVEVEEWRQQIGLTDPFIVENGSAVFLPVQQSWLNPPEQAERVGDYALILLGCSYVQARAAMKVVGQMIGRPLQGFGDLTPEKVQSLTGLSVAETKQAKAREFSEPFLTPQTTTPEILRAMVEDLGFRVVVGDRFSHLIGGDAGKGVAVRQVTALYQALLPAGQRLQTVGLGNSPNDLEMLENVDIPLIIPGVDGSHPQLAERGWRVADAPAPEGWAAAVKAVLSELGAATFE